MSERPIPLFGVFFFFFPRYFYHFFKQNVIVLRTFNDYFLLSCVERNTDKDNNQDGLDSRRIQITFLSAKK